MFGFRNSRRSDEELSRQYVRQAFAVGREICPSIADALQITTHGDVAFPVNDDVSLEISLAILGTSLAVLKGHSQVMTAHRGSEVERFCRRSIEEDYNLPSDTVGKLNASLDEYQDAFQKSMANENNPFGDISGIMLCRCLGPRAGGRARRHALRGLARRRRRRRRNLCAALERGELGRDRCRVGQRWLDQRQRRRIMPSRAGGRAGRHALRGMAR